MPNVDDLKTSQFIIKGDVGDGLLLTIKKWEKMDVSMENKPEDMKYVLVFNEHPKPFVLNQTNGKRIAKAVGSADFDDWIGEKIVLFIDEDVEFGGKTVGGIRCRAPKEQTGEQPKVEDKDIPF